MRRIIASLTVLLLCILAVPASASAFDPFQTVCQTGGSSSSVCTTDAGGSSGTDPVTTKIAEVTELIAYAAGIIAVIIIIVSGIRFMTSGGDSNSVNAARSTLIYAAIGLVVIAVGESLILFVLSKL